METGKCPAETIHNLIQVSKKLGEANRSKQKYTLQLLQLTFYKNFTELIKENEKEILQSIFHFTTQVVPDAQGCGDSIFLTVENINKEMTFDSLYWYFTLSFNKGTNVSVWKLDTSLCPGKKESFVTKFIASPDFSPVEIQVNLTFAINFNETHFLRVFDLTTILVDILYLLSPSKRIPCTSKTSNIYPPYFLRLDPALSEEAKSLPPILKFNLKCNENLRSTILSLLLKDSNHRGFPGCSYESDSKTLSDIQIHVDEERILLSQELDVISVKTFNPKLLFALKVAVFERLFKVDGLKISCPSDEDCDKLYRLKLRLESSNGNDNLSLQTGDFEEVYLSLKQIIEGLKFCAKNTAVAETNLTSGQGQDAEPVHPPVVVDLEPD